jgi:hypothetical protein
MFIRITNVTLSESVDTCLRNGWSTSHRALDDFNGNFKHGPPSNNNKYFIIILLLISNVSLNKL